MPNGKLKRIHVNQHIIRKNRGASVPEPPITVKLSGRNVRATRIVIDGPAEVIYSPEKPLSCGARVWVETRSVVTVYSGDYEETLW